MGTEKRQRQKQGRQARLAEEQTTHKRTQRRRRMVAGVVVALVVFVGLLLLSQAGTDDPAQEVDQAQGTDDTPAADEEAGEPTECPPVDGSAERRVEFSSPPPMCIDPAKDYLARVTTSEGAFTIDLLEDAAPQTVNNFVVLARYGYYDGDDFHRIIPGFVVQGGDPVGQPPGTGGPGYEFGDELPESVDAYVEGAVAMANSGPDTNGSQFFIYTGPNPLPGPQYSLFGQVTEGLEVVKAIEALGSPTGQPQRAVAITAVDIVEQ